MAAPKFQVGDTVAYMGIFGVVRAVVIDFDDCEGYYSILTEENRDFDDIEEWELAIVRSRNEA